MLFSIVVALYFSVLFSIAAILEVCLFRLEDFRRTQRNNYPEICSVIDKIWSVLHNVIKLKFLPNTKKHPPRLI